MAKNPKKFRFNKKVKHYKKSLNFAGQQVGKTFDKLVVGRWRNLRPVRRFVLGWLVLVSLLIFGIYLQNQALGKYYLVDKPVSGGTFREGVIGNVTNVNPIYSTSLADSSVSKLIFNSLLTYDQNNRLVGDLAQSYKANKDGTVYTVKLKTNVFWHDGQEFNADDVVFTFDAIAHPDSKSYLNASWRNVKVQKIDDYTVTFSLPNSFAPFPHSLTRGGILPEHVLGGVEPVQLRAHPFNTETPIGTGPFKLDELNIEEDLNSVVRLEKNEQYFKGTPGIDKFILTSYTDREDLLFDYQNGDITAAAGVQATERNLLRENLIDTWHNIELNSGVYAFMNTSKDKLKEVKVRRALLHATNNTALVNMMDSIESEVDSPLIEQQIDLNKFPKQTGFNIKKAEKLLDEAGWKKQNDGFRYKKKEKLSFQLVTQSSDNYPLAAQLLKEQWFEAGIDLQVLIVEETSIQDSYIVPHNYEILLFGVALGNDPDVFAYWHSSQANIGGFNLSEYKNEVVDTALEGGRTRLDKELRRAKYKTFQEQWVKDAPAIGLYQPTFVYVLRDNVAGFDINDVNNPSDRYAQVHNWKVSQEEVKRFKPAF